MAPPSEALRKTAFAPVADARTRLLVLGSLPGQISLDRQQYYANPRNQFWRLMEAVVDAPLVEADYETRLATLLDAGVGLWDVIGAARRDGSLDAAIRDYDANPLADAVAGLPSLRTLAFNGGKAFAIGRRQLARTPGLALVPLPSSSPAYCAIDLDAKRARWAGLRPLLA